MKTILRCSIGLFLLIVASYQLDAQIAIATNDTDVLAYENPGNDFFHSSSTRNISAKEATPSKGELAEMYDQSVEASFGSYYNPHSDSYKVKLAELIKYTKGQLVDESGKTVKRFKIKALSTALELGELERGNYTLLLTNDGAALYSEDFSVF